MDVNKFFKTRRPALNCISRESTIILLDFVSRGYMLEAHSENQQQQQMNMEPSVNRAHHVIRHKRGRTVHRPKRGAFSF